MVSTRVPSELVGIAVVGILSEKNHWYAVSQGRTIEHPVSAVFKPAPGNAEGNVCNTPSSENVTKIDPLGGGCEIGPIDEVVVEKDAFPVPSWDTAV